MAIQAVTRSQALAWRLRRQHLVAGAADVIPPSVNAPVARMAETTWMTSQ